MRGDPVESFFRMPARRVGKCILSWGKHLLVEAYGNVDGIPAPTYTFFAQLVEMRPI